LTDQLDAAPGVALSAGAFPSLTSGSSRLNRTFADVVSVASPGSSDGGSAPSAWRRTWAFWEWFDIAAAELATVIAMSVTSPAQR
jgi:hypothetical protein